MKLFESSKTRRSRLFESVGWRAYATAEHVAEQQRDAHQAAYMFLLADLAMVGSATALVAVEDCQGLKKTWGKGDRTKAQNLSLVFTLAMWSPWLHSYLSIGEGQEVAANGIVESCKLTYVVFEKEASPQDTDRFLKFDAEYNHWEGSPDDRGWLMLLYAQALEACDYPTNVAWKTLEIPVSVERMAAALPENREQESHTLFSLYWRGLWQTVERYCRRSGDPVPMGYGGLIRGTPFRAIEVLRGRRPS